ncbi:MAG: polysaccharide biosynthesis/export family protein [Polaromonas sp.]|nr:polysaccharide biosynthesis/export family protein [Polaromonas sp.]
MHNIDRDLLVTSQSLASPRLLVRCLLPLLTATLLGGCVFAPGMSAGKRLPSATATGSAQGAPEGALIPITPELLRAQRSAQPSDVSSDVRSLFGTAEQYRIGAGDVLTITVWDHPEIQQRPITSSDSSGVLGVLNVPGYNVSPEGLVQFPYVGTVQVGGLTELQARDKLAAALGKYFKDPQVTLQMQAYRSGRIYVEGEVKNPGLQAITDTSTTLPVVIGRAGSLLPTGDRSGVTLTRGGKTTRIDMQQLTAQGVDPASIVLRNGDVVRVLAREDSKVFVLGEVPRPGSQLLRNGRLTLNEALGDASGVNPTSGDPRQIYVVRGGATATPEIYHLDAATAANYALAEGFELKARDVVFVDPVPLVNWNRVVSLILPSAQTANQARDATRR